MRKQYFYSILIAVVCTTACSQKEVDMPEQQGNKVRFTAILEDMSTRTYLGEKDDEDMFPVYWSEGDKIKMFVSQHEISDGVGYQLDLESGAGTVESVFSGNIPALPDGSLYYYAVYPYSLPASIGGNAPWDAGISPAEGTWDPGDGNLWELANHLQMPLPSVQQYAPHSFGKDYNPVIAASRDQTLRFKNVCGVLRINLTGDVNVGKIVVEGDGGAALWGVLLAQFRWRQRTSETQVSTHLITGESMGYRDRKTLTLDCGEGVQLSDEPTDFYLVMPVLSRSGWNGGDYYDPTDSPLSDGFTMRVYDTDGEEVFAKHTDRDNSIHRSMIRNMPVLDVRRQDMTDLSANGTANSYMVRPNGGTYRFYAANRGVSPQPVHENAGILQHAVAEVLWETRMSSSVETSLNDIVRHVSYNPETKYISFETTSNPGNALIALKDASDNVLWSWLIWSSDYNPDAAGGTDMYGSVEMMNRHLGALKKDMEDESAYGLYFQWGRKDPFDKGYEEGRYRFYPSMPFSKEQDGKLNEDLIKIPTTYVFTVGDIYNLDLADIALNWGKEKTMHDPCPPGWQVPDFDTYYQFASTLNNASFNVTDMGSYVLFNSSNPAAVYPKEPTWTSLHHQSYWGAVSYDSFSFLTGRYSAEPNHIRCQRTDTPIDLRPVINLSAEGTANCYLARPKNKYKLYARVKGNSNISTGMMANAHIEYYTENTNVLHETRYGGLRMEDALLTDCYLKDGYIYFTTSLDNVYGNATLVLKDQRGQVLWSWHIWIVDYDPETSYDVVDWGEAGQKKMMTMNLGALNNTKHDSRAMGMMYQWGRKDPFLGAVAYDSNSQVVHDGNNYGWVDASEETSTLFYAMRYPSKAIMGQAEGDGDWLSEHDNTLWGEVKTIYDPCPRGWKVPTRPIYHDKVVSSEFDFGMQMEGIWYPAAGFHHPVSFNLNQVGREGHYWYATPSDDGHSYVFYFSSENQTVDLVNHSDPKSQLNTIRCIKDE